MAERVPGCSSASCRIEKPRPCAPSLPERPTASWPRSSTSLSTVKTHVQRIIRKLGVSDPTRASVKAVETGLLLTPK